MKTLLLMRHAKSDWSADFGRDEERPINGRGRRAAARMGRWLSAIDGVPDRIVSSPAVRARATAERAAEAGAWGRPIDLEPRIYEAAPRTLVDVVSATGEETSVLLLVGHEPGLSGALDHLLGGAAVRFPTAAIARVDLDIDSWADAESGCGLLVWLVLPRLLPD